MTDDQTTMIDFAPTVHRVTALLSGVSDGQLSAPTPCGTYSVGDLLDHFMRLAIGMRHAAEKTTATAGPDDPAPGEGSADRLDPEWRQELPRRLDALTAAWREPSAWQGTTVAGGVTMPAQMMGVVALDELLIHGWDLARATGQPYDCDARSAEAIIGWLSAFPDEQRPDGAFGPMVSVPDDAPPLDRAVALSGRDPKWQA
ncbi:TIGR03086 family metal-binding protein [Streptomyces antimycoticus]|uniref:TIGR03086 family protein n=1 Tax=Streptomyces antimycoticus TaxID=68175 RepID=A0A499UFE1_9ACTN|nr:TIGR03086 family metal-binding protein [Streptomyces antimycoticus]BBJ40285.1 TIGR03086 family protein [Streptomyces antimycoticus]